MRIMTINTHSYIEDNPEEKLNIFIDAANRIKPDIIAMQEINQPCCNIEESSPAPVFQYGIPLKRDNFCMRAAASLAKKNNPYYFSWAGIKKSYDRFDEGLCFLTKKLPQKHDAFIISRTQIRDNWKKRAALGVMIDGEWFYNLHMGRWDDAEDPFEKQWECFLKKSQKSDFMWLMGDFNSPCDKKGEGYDRIISDNWHDTYLIASDKDAGHTVTKNIDGWEDSSPGKTRIDYIFTNQPRKILSSYTIFNGVNEKTISDHYGIIIEY